MIHLDTNFLIDTVVGGTPQEQLTVQWLSLGTPLLMSAVAWGEFVCGPITPRAEAVARRLLRAVSPLEQVDAELAARLFNLTGRRSKSFADCCIAAVAIREQAALATSNVSDFAPFLPWGLRLA